MGLSCGRLPEGAGRLNKLWPRTPAPLRRTIVAAEPWPCMRCRSPSSWRRPRQPREPGRLTLCPRPLSPSCGRHLGHLSQETDRSPSAPGADRYPLPGLSQATCQPAPGDAGVLVAASPTQGRCLHCLLTVILPLTKGADVCPPPWGGGRSLPCPGGVGAGMAGWGGTPGLCGGR